MYRSTAVSMIVNELTGVIALLIDGIITSQSLGVEVYAGISLLKPFTSLVLLLVGVLSTGCNLVSSRMIGIGKKKEANEAFNLASLLCVLISVLLILLCLRFPNMVLNLCGIDLSKHPQLNQHIYSYLNGYLIGLPALMLVQVFGPILVMDNGKRFFTLSSVLLCTADIIGDLLNAYVFHGGAFGMGLATSAAYIIQLLILAFHFTGKDTYFKISLKACSLRPLKELLRNGTPALIKKMSGTLRDIFINYINIMVAVGTVAIAAKGIQNDIFSFLFCIPTGLGRTLLLMTGIYYSAKDVQGLERLLSYACRFAALLTGIAALFTIAAAHFFAGLFTSDPEVLPLAVFGIRWMAVGLVFDTPIVLMQHFHQGADNLKRSTILNICERFVAPTLAAVILGHLFGSKGVLASFGVSKIILLSSLFVNNCIHNHGLPKDWRQIMYLPKGFGGAQSDNMYAEIRTIDDAVQTSEQVHKFCLEHQIDNKKAYFTALCVEEMAVNVIKHAEKKGIGNVCIDYHLSLNDGSISMSLTDLSEHFDPTLFYEQHLQDAPTDHIGIRMITEIAKDIRYYSTFRSNNLLINI